MRWFVAGLAVGVTIPTALVGWFALEWRGFVRGFA